MTDRIPASAYTSRAAHEREAERLWPRVWLLAGHAREVAVPGDWFVFDLGRESLVVTCDDAGRARAFHNVCQHRGMRLCADDRGHGPALRCPYHQWVWGLDGGLLSGTRDETLAEVRCQVRHGFVFVHLGDDPPDLAEFLGPLDDRIASWRPADFALASDQTVAIACNWKTSADVSNESHHLPMVHPELAEVADLDDVRVELLGTHSAIRVTIGAPRGAGGELVAGLLARAGVGPDERPRTHAEVRAALRAAARRTIAASFPGLALDDDQLVDKHQLYVFPNVQLNFHAFSLELYRHRPHPEDPGRCFFDEQAYERRAPGTRAEPPPRARFAHGERALGPVMGRDVDLLPGLQRGMASRGFRGLRIERGEEPIANMHRALAAYVDGPA